MTWLPSFRSGLGATLVGVLAVTASMPACTSSLISETVRLRCQFEGRDQVVRVSFTLDLEEGTATRILEDVPQEQSLWTGTATSGGVIARSEEYSIWMASRVAGIPEAESTWRWAVDRKTGDATMTVNYGAIDESPTVSKGHCSEG
jgi:hypothetical protein